MANDRAIRGGNAGALLATMLQRIQAEVGEIRGLRVTEDPEYAAFFPEFVEHPHIPRAFSVRVHAIARAASK